MTKARDLSKLLSTANGKIAGSNLDVSFENITDTGTEGTKVATGTTAQRGSTAGQIRFNSTTGLAEYYTGTSFKSIDSPPTISSIDVTEVDSQAGGNQTIVITGSGFNSGATVTFVGASGTDFNASTVTRDSDTQLTVVAPKASFLNAQEPYGVKVINVSGLSATLASQINVDSAPSWSTASGTIATINDNATGTHATVSATDADGDTVSYSETGGTVLSTNNFTLNSSTGAISGDPVDVVSSTTHTFTLRATANSKTSDRIFNIIVNPTLDGSTSAKAALSAQDIRDLGITTNGVYYLKNSNGDTYQAYCDMNVQSGGWELIWNTAGNASNNGDPRSDFAGYNNKNFWTNQTWTTGTTSTPFSTVMYKGSGYQYRNDFTKIMIVAHQGGGACDTAFGASSGSFGSVGGIWTLNSTYQNKSWYQLMNDYANATTIASFTTQMGALTTSNQTSGIISNTTRNGVKGDSAGHDNRTIGLPLFDNQLDLVTNVYLKGTSPDPNSSNFDSNGGLYDLNQRTPTSYSGSNPAGNASNRSPDFVMNNDVLYNMARLTGKYSQLNLDVRNLSSQGNQNGHQTQGGLGIHHRKGNYILHAHAHFSMGYYQGEFSMGTSENQNFDGGNNQFYTGTGSPSAPVIGRSRVDFAIFVKN